MKVRLMIAVAVLLFSFVHTSSAIAGRYQKGDCLQTVRVGEGLINKGRRYIITGIVEAELADDVVIKIIDLKGDSSIFWEGKDRYEGDTARFPKIGMNLCSGGQDSSKSSSSESSAPSFINIEYIRIPGGTFRMGSNSSDDVKPVHEVTVRSFELGNYEVTQGQWKAVMGSNPSYFKECGDGCPVEQVSWNDVQEFMRKLNAKGNGCTYRLPTEAEWEYACRSGGKDEKYCGGSDVDAVAWYDDNGGSKTHPVGQKAPNGLGLYDMSGNVREWVSDWYEGNYYANSPRDNPQGPSGGSGRVFRGGSVFNAYVLSSVRSYDAPGDHDGALGFRLARTCP